MLSRTGRCLACLWLAEIDASRQFPDAENIESVLYNIGTQRAGTNQGFENFGRSQIAKQLEVFAQWK